MTNANDKLQKLFKFHFPYIEFYNKDKILLPINMIDKFIVEYSKFQDEADHTEVLNRYLLYEKKTYDSTND